MVCHGDVYGVMAFASFRLRATNMQCELLCSSRTLDVQDVQESVDLAASFLAKLQVVFLYMLQFLTLEIVLADLRDVF